VIVEFIVQVMRRPRLLGKSWLQELNEPAFLSSISSLTRSMSGAGTGLSPLISSKGDQEVSTTFMTEPLTTASSVDTWFGDTRGVSCVDFAVIACERLAVIR